MSKWIFFCAVLSLCSCSYFRLDREKVDALEKEAEQDVKDGAAWYNRVFN